MASATAGSCQTAEGIEAAIEDEILHNVSKDSTSTPLIINLPAFPTQNVEDVGSYLPRFLHNFPTATIHYRWTDRQGDLKTFPKHGGAGTPPSPDDPSGAISRYIPTPLHWPTPLHDTIFGYEWLIKNLSPPGLKRRAIYVYGSYLGASLASSLALTESHTHEPMAVRGLMAFNGIYNWSRMLPGHPTNKIILDDAVAAAEAAAEKADPIEPEATGDPSGGVVALNDQDVAPLKGLVPTLFRHPFNLFDPFASPVLFFHTAGMPVPPKFDPPKSYRDLGGAADPDDDLPYVYSDPEDTPPPTFYDDEEDGVGGGRESTTGIADKDLDFTAFSKWPPPPPRKGYFAFPPLTSSLKIPETLLMHTTSTATPLLDAATGKKVPLARLRKLKSAENSFEAHALSLGNLMRKSINRMELRERLNWDPDIHGLREEAVRRVEVEDVGEVMRDEAGQIGESGLSDEGEEIALRWLQDRVG
ncbi:hypothetical protein VMCG_05890 [Cytospora schulzeri]|uniref:Uncharacterized protein n=1 Tax=Cytospora schulzeri TaxID=448051 RepID=A0A423WD12_9PEZI|nr:hypothetical protein VMCG_05890 [Valsa malicola]